MLTISSPDPIALLNALKEGIANGLIEAWRCNDDADFQFRDEQAVASGYYLRAEPSKGALHLHVRAAFESNHDSRHDAYARLHGLMTETMLLYLRTSIGAGGICSVPRSIGPD